MILILTYFKNVGEGIFIGNLVFGFYCFLNIQIIIKKAQNYIFFLNLYNFLIILLS